MTTESSFDWTDLVAALRSVDAFAKLPDVMLDELASEMELVSLAGDETVIRQDEITDKLYVVIGGGSASRGRN